MKWQTDKDANRGRETLIHEHRQPDARPTDEDIGRETQRPRKKGRQRKEGRKEELDKQKKQLRNKIGEWKKVLEN